MTEVMIDLETLSTRPNAMILTLGAVRFNRRGVPRELKDMDSFYRRIDMKSCVDAGLHTSVQTREWWEQQGEAARHEALVHKERVPLKQALTEFTSWFGRAKNVWSHGSSFDCVIMEQAYRACDMSPPWKFWSLRDTRTIYDLSGISIRDFPVKVKHHALHDAFCQVQAVKASVKKLGC
jgi:hypothetical protein